MFITHTAFASPIGGLANTLTTKHWSALELAFECTWFLMQIQKVDPMDNNSEVHDTLLIEDIENAVQLAEQGTSGPVQLEAVYAITPGHVNQSGQWRMDLVKALWMADHPGSQGVKVKICEMSTGEKFVISLLGPSISDVKEHTLTCQFFV
jgi:hypothetical protein